MNTASVAQAVPPRSSIGRLILGVLAVLFGFATLAEGSQVLFGSEAARAEAGNVVPFVLMFNFGAGFLYVTSGLATLFKRDFTVWVARALAVSTLLVFAAFGVHVLAGGAHETRTIVAMTVRSSFWVAQALLLARLFGHGRPA
jgi:hypothetical protein